MSACFPYKVKGEKPYLSADTVISAKLYNKTDPAFFMNVEMFFDSGASISLAPASLADALGLVLTEGDPVTLVGVGGTVSAYVHYSGAEVGGINIDLPIAIAEIETVPLLFGMYGPMDQFSQFVLDNNGRQLCLHVSPPVLKPLWAERFPILWNTLARFLRR